MQENGSWLIFIPFPMKTAAFHKSACVCTRASVCACAKADHVWLVNVCVRKGSPCVVGKCACVCVCYTGIHSHIYYIVLYTTTVCTLHCSYKPFCTLKLQLTVGCGVGSLWTVV